MAARLWKAGKAPKILVSGRDAYRSTVGLLEDFGVPTNALVKVDDPRNTEQEVKCIASLVADSTALRPKVLVVTSAWHMKRSMMMYRKYAGSIEALPAPCDFEYSSSAGSPLSLTDFLPSAIAMHYNSVAIHEWIGIVGYSLFR